MMMPCLAGKRQEWRNGGCEMCIYTEKSTDNIPQCRDCREWDERGLWNVSLCWFFIFQIPHTLFIFRNCKSGTAVQSAESSSRPVGPSSFVHTLLLLIYRTLCLGGGASAVYREEFRVGWGGHRHVVVDDDFFGARWRLFKNGFPV